MTIMELSPMPYVGRCAALARYENPRRNNACPSCGGTGHVKFHFGPPEPELCSNCNGSGDVRVFYRKRFVADYLEKRKVRNSLIKHKESKYVDVPKTVEVTLLIKAGLIQVEVYDLDNENDHFCWCANERISTAIIISQKNISFVRVSKEQANSIEKRRAELRVRAKARVSEERKNMNKAAHG